VPVDVIHFNPARRGPGLLGKFLPKRPLNNFGDLIGPMLVQKIIETHELKQPIEYRRLVAVGSIMRLTRSGDTVWGTGINGKTMSTGAAPDLDVRAVRGPRTRDLLLKTGMTVPEVYGDPALLWPTFWPKDYYLNPMAGRMPYLVLPNYNDRNLLSAANSFSPLNHPHAVISKIVNASFVCGTSLHAIILAEAYGIPARLICSQHEPIFKYDDYYRGTGRAKYEIANSVSEALEMGGEKPPEFDSSALYGVFPFDLYA